MTLEPTFLPISSAGFRLEPFDESHDTQRVVVAIMANRLIVLAKRFQDKKGTTSKKHLAKLQADINMRTDVLFGYLLDNFWGDVTVDDVRGIFDQSTSVMFIGQQELTQIPVRHVPVFVFRVLMHNHMLRFSPSECVNWERFMLRYKDAIAAA